MEIIRILLVDDHQIFRDALRSLLESNPGLKVVGETGNAFELVNLVKKTTPDIVCMDIGLPGMNGILTTQLLVANFPKIKVIALSSYSDRQCVSDMIKAGASAYITKGEASDELLRAISAVRKNRKYFCSDIADALSESMIPPEKSNSPVKLGNRERQVLQLVAEGKSSEKIANLLHIAPSTVDVHRRNIMHKLNLHKVAELTRYAISNKIIT